MSTISDQVEDAWRSRAKTQNLTPKSMAYKRAEVEFFVGAMAALQAALPGDDPHRLTSAVPPKWTIHIMSGRPVVDL